MVQIDAAGELSLPGVDLPSAFAGAASSGVRPGLFIFGLKARLGPGDLRAVRLDVVACSGFGQAGLGGA
jgi:hypothetical protein